MSLIRTIFGAAIVATAIVLLVWSNSLNKCEPSSPRGPTIATAMRLGGC